MIDKAYAIMLAAMTAGVNMPVVNNMAADPPAAPKPAEKPPVVEGSCWVDKQGVAHGHCVTKPVIPPKGAK